MLITTMELGIATATASASDRFYTSFPRLLVPQYNMTLRNHAGTLHTASR